MNRRDGILQVLRAKLTNLEQIDNKSVQRLAGGAMNMLCMLEDDERRRKPPPVNVWGALQRVVSRSEKIVSLFDEKSVVPSAAVEELREELQTLVKCEVEKIV